MSVFLLVLVPAALALWASRSVSPRMRKIAMIAFAAHVAGAFGQYGLQVYYYGISDVFLYLQSGKDLARLLSLDFGRFAPEIGLLILHQPTELPFEAFGQGSSTGSMSGIAGFLVYFFGDSMLAAFLFSSFFGWLGQLQTYLAFEEDVGEANRGSLALATLLVPSVIFWGSAFAKETYVLCALGLLLRSGRGFMRTKSPLSVVGIAVGGLGVGLLKPYTLLPLVLAVGGWMYARYATALEGTRFRRIYLLATPVLVVAGVVVIGTLFPEYGADRIAETTAIQQANWADVGGGTTFDFGSGEARTISQQVVFVPLAFINAMFRPFILEARNAPAFGAALETTALTIALATLLFRQPIRTLRQRVLASPPLAFCAAFVPTFAIAVGLGSANLGSLSRYRVPMMPFYVLFVLLLRSSSSAPEEPPMEEQRG